MARHGVPLTHPSTVKNGESEQTEYVAPLIGPDRNALSQLACTASDIHPLLAQLSQFAEKTE